MPDDDDIIIEPVSEREDRNWTPEIGPETLAFLESSVPVAAQDSISASSVMILSKAVSPHQPAGQETGLVVGYVQSGKTMSFEAVATLARDNGFQMVIVVAGISNPLFEQSTRRLTRDLQLDDPRRERRWIHFGNPGDNDATLQPIRDVLDEWRDPRTPPEYKRTILITVLKYHRRLHNLTALLRSLDLRGAPVLIIDDEADQASLNTEAAQGQESTNYRRLMEMRQVIPNHTYLQYTATPQAPLLISIIDSLSPNFVQVLDPGNEYVGGEDFFGDGNLPLVRLIPPGDVPTNANPLTDPPDSLLEALRVFMVGVTAGIRQSRNRGNRSMLVHPSHRTAPHETFYGWVRDIFDAWRSILNLPDNDPDRQELVEDFRVAHDDLLGTGAELPPFDELAPHLRHAFLNTRVLEVNAREGRTPEVDWRSMYGWILVGGQAMDRGFTVEGLTVTYMPRGIGVGNADTIQQRARFFGYKRSYLGYCRVYLEQGTLSAFQNYVQHERDMRSQLQQIQQTGQRLNDWKRAFVMDRNLSPCRRNVLEFDYIRGRFSDDWVSPRVVLGSDSALEDNRRTLALFGNDLVFSEDEGHADRTDIQRHAVSRDVPLRRVVEELLVRMRITGTTDSQRNTGLLLQLSKALEDDPDELCSVYRISEGRRRQRGVDENGEVTNLFQGEAPVNPRERRGEIYPGDRAIRDPDENVTIQIHTLDLTREGSVIAENVPILAVWVPARLARSWIAQEDQPQPS